MWVYIARRLLWLPVLLIATSLFTFTLLRFGPGDPAEVILGARYDETAANQIRHQLGLDRPFSVQYATYIWGVLKGDFGESYRFRGRQVSELLFPKM